MQMSILLVEDDRPLREVLAEYLEDLGFAVATAGDGDEALELIVSEGLRPAILVLDLKMPVMNGWELLAAFDRSDVLASIPCVVITGVTAHGLQDRPGTTVLNKPFTTSELVRQLRRLQEEAPAPHS